MGSKRKLFVFYTVEFLTIAIAIFYSFQNFSMVSGDDGVNQFYPAFVYCGKYIREALGSILKGKLHFPQYDFSIGLGDGIIPVLNGYGIGDPFMLISGLVPVKYSAYAYTAVILLKLYVSGWGFIYYCKKRNIAETAILGGTAFYVVNNYVFCMGFMYPSFLSTQISLPFLCGGIDQIINNNGKEKRISIVLVLSVAYQALYGFYFLYIELMFAAVYALVQLLCNMQSVKRFFSEIVILFGHIALGLMISGIFLIPTIVEYISSSRGGDFVWLGLKGLLILDTGEYWKAFSSLVAPVDTIGFGLMIPSISFLLIYFAFRGKEEYNELKILMVVLTFAYLEMRLTSYIAGGFTPDIYYNRWIFCFMFLIAVMTSLGIGKIKRVPKKFMRLLGGGYLIINIIYFLTLIFVEQKYLSDGMKMQRQHIYYIYLLAAVVTAIFIFLFTKVDNIKGVRIEGFVSVCVLLSVILTVIMLFGTIGKYGYGAKWRYKTYESVRNEFLASNTQLYSFDENIFSRKDIKGNSENEALYIGHNGVRQYFSMINQNIYEFYRQFMITSGLNGTNYILGGLNSRSGIEDLLAVRYYDDVKKDVIVENRNQLPIAFTFDKYCYQEEAETSSAIEKNANILNSVILDQDITDIEKLNLQEADSELWKEELCEIDYVNIDYDNTKISVTPESKIVITVESEKGGECYFYAGEFRVENLVISTVYFNEISCQFRHNNLQSRLKEHPAMVCLGTIEEGKTTFEISFEDNSEYVIDDIHVYTVDLNEIEKQNTERRDGALSNIKVENDCISGDINLDKKQVLFFSVPYSVGWTACVNGKKAEIIKADYGFMALVLEEGAYNIELKYFTPGLRVGIVCTILGLILLLVLNKMSINRK